MDASDRIGLEVSGTNNRGSANSRNSSKIKQVQNAKIKTDYIKHVIIIDFQTPHAITGVVEFQR